MPRRVVLNVQIPFVDTPNVLDGTFEIYNL